jgi:hypothetical protein
MTSLDLNNDNRTSLNGLNVKSAYSNLKEDEDEESSSLSSCLPSPPLADDRVDTSERTEPSTIAELVATEASSPFLVKNEIIQQVSKGCNETVCNAPANKISITQSGQAIHNRESKQQTKQLNVLENKQPTASLPTRPIVYKYNLGDLVWAKVSGHPWWPCIVCSSLNGDEAQSESPPSHVRYASETIRSRLSYFLRLYGPLSESAWVLESNLIDYKGIEAFKTYAQDQVDQALTKSAKEKLAERFQLKVALSRREHWERAVREADVAIAKSSSERLVDFKRNAQVSFNLENAKKTSTLASSNSNPNQHSQSNNENGS